MRIAMLGWEFPPSITGGLGVHCFELVSNLARLGVKVDFFLPKQKQKVFSPHKNARVIELGDSAEFGVYSTTLMHEIDNNYSTNLVQSVDAFAHIACRTISESGIAYDIVHSHDWLTVPAGILVKYSMNLPLILTLHSTEFDRNPYPWNWIVDIESQGVRNAEIVIAVSNRLKNLILEKSGIPESKMKVVYNGIDYGKYARWQPHKGASKSVLFLGRLTHQKGAEQFLRAAKKVHEFGGNVRFVIAGEGELLPHLIQLSIDLGISDVVSFTGFISEEEKNDIYSLCDLYVMPSVSEPFGITALEAMASGTPCIISKSSGVSEIAQNCLLVDFWDVDEMASKILALLEYPAIGKAMSANELLEVRKFTWARTARQTLGIYRELLTALNRSYTV